MDITGATLPDTIKIGLSEHFFYAGAEMMRTAEKKIAVEMGYGLTKSKLIARITWIRKNFDTSLAFYPESAWALWPLVNVQWRW